MAFELSSEQTMIRLMARDFARKELEPNASDWDKQGVFPIGAIKKMGELGLLGMMVPVEYGGSGAGAVAYSLALQEIAYSCASSAVTMSVASPRLLTGGSPKRTTATEPEREVSTVLMGFPRGDGGLCTGFERLPVTGTARTCF